MPNHEILQEQYNDALFEMLMDDLASNEGKLYMEENARLLQDPSSGIPPETDQRILQLVERETAKASRHQSAKVFMKWLGRLAIAALLAALLFGAAYALSPAFRAGTLNLLMRIDERLASWQFVSDDALSMMSTDQTLLPEVSIGWLPDGYERQLPKTQGPDITIFDCIDSDGRMITVFVVSVNSTIYNLDIENCDYFKDINIQGNQGLLITKDGTTRISWIDDNMGVIVLVQSADIDTEALIRIADSITLF